MLKRLFNISKSNVHAVIDQFEDPIKMTEQGIRDLKKDHEAAMRSLAQVKSIAIRTRKEATAKQRLAREYEDKAKLLLLKAGKGSLDTVEAERLATMALDEQSKLLTENQRQDREAKGHETMVKDLDIKVARLRATLTTYENELATLKARAKTAASTKKINAQLAAIDTSGTIAMLERMKERVEEDESLASAYGEIAARETSVDKEIDQALEEKKPEASARLEQLKQRMGIDSQAMDPGAPAITR
ncbi:MAG: PspA/IM30 family protein [Desulfobacteraceae bacterium]|nr:PspA/IM30 family protein [Desulfobacteraceae bacterium]